jgi:O-acetyl-ADP-ribose deacetylase (regulator of RNase III)
MRGTEILYRVGDATAPEDPSGGRMIICHVCNDQGGWGSGFVVALSRRWPGPEREYRELHRNYRLQLGWVQMVRVHQRIAVANMIAQHGYKRSPDGIPLDYDALRKCLDGVAQAAINNGCSIHMPRIGAGLAGGDWLKIADIVKETMCDRGLRVTVYDLPEEEGRWPKR